MNWGDVPTWAAILATSGFSLAAWRNSRKALGHQLSETRRVAWEQNTPNFEITLESQEGDRATLNVQLRGPIALDHLDEIRIRITSSDDMVRNERFPGHGRPTQEDLDAQVWGPYRFAHGANGADVNGQSVSPFSLPVGRGCPFSIERTRAPFWQEGQDRQRRWEEQWRNRPIRLVLECRRTGFDPWRVPYDVEVPGAAS